MRCKIGTGIATSLAQTFEFNKPAGLVASDGPLKLTLTLATTVVSYPLAETVAASLKYNFI